LWLGFDKLAMDVFRLNLAPWREAGYGADFIPYSVVKDGEVVANVAFNRMRLLIGGRPQSAFQLSTVMTRPDFRGQGLSALLIRHILEEHAADCDFFYLFANETVLSLPALRFRRPERGRSPNFCLPPTEDRSAGWIWIRTEIWRFSSG
jgi:GNAT superfamily N-acetyltransferase